MNEYDFTTGLVGTANTREMSNTLPVIIMAKHKAGVDRSGNQRWSIAINISTSVLKMLGAQKNSRFALKLFRDKNELALVLNEDGFKVSQVQLKYEYLQIKFRDYHVFDIEYGDNHSVYLQDCKIFKEKGAIVFPVKYI